MLYIVQIGILLAGATVVLHALGTILWVHLLVRSRARLRSYAKRFESTNPKLQMRYQLRSVLRFIFGTTIAIIALHVTEVLMWAAAYCWLPKEAHPLDFPDAVYFSMVTFTTLGYGDIVIESHWRLLAGIEAMAGMLVFGWSSAMLYAAVSQVLTTHINNKLADERKQNETTSNQ